MTVLKRLGRAAIWIINYELWRYNVKITAQTIKTRRAQKADTETWGKATD